MIVRVNKNSNYTVMSNHHLRNKNLSLKAKGLLSVILSLPEEWDYSISGLVAISRENETAIKSALVELKTEGYLVITKKMPNETESGRYEYIYDFYESPEDQKQEGKKQEVEILPLEILPVENLPLNKDTNKLNKEKLNTDEIRDSDQKKKRFVVPSLDEVTSYCQERNNHVDPQRFIDYYSSNGWKVGKNKMVDWKACVRTWERNQGSTKSSSQGTDDPFITQMRKEGLL